LPLNVQSGKVDMADTLLLGDKATHHYSEVIHQYNSPSSQPIQPCFRTVNSAMQNSNHRYILLPDGCTELY